MVEMVAAELLPLTSLDKAEVEGYWREFTENGEAENVLWELATLSIDEYYERQEADRRNRRFGFLVGGALVGMVRISSRINYEANGKVGYSIRPSCRKRLYAPTLLRGCDQRGVAQSVPAGWVRTDRPGVRLDAPEESD